GLQIVAVAVVAQAVIGMARVLCPDLPRAALALGAAALMFLVPASLGQIIVIAAGGLIGWAVLPAEKRKVEALSFNVSRPNAIRSLVLFFALLAVLPVANLISGNHVVAL